jgi:hypothetical protein
VHLVGIYTIEYDIEGYYRILIHVRTVAITVNETWNDHEQDGSHLASKWLTMAQNEFTQQRDLWNKLMHYESASDGDTSDCSVSVRARTVTLLLVLIQTSPC